MNELLAQSTPLQITLFCLIGLINTLLDFVIYNLLTKKLSRIPANILSTSVAMAFSFSANFFVFQPGVVRAPEQAVKFIVVTAFSLYVIQNVIIYVTSNLWVQPVKAAQALSQKCPLTRNCSDSFISKNTVKLLATVCSMIWNFLWYKYYVYL